MNTPDTSKKSGYQPAQWEDILYQEWLDSGYFNPDTCLEKGVANAAKPPFSIVLPPPNATGTLHVGHAAMLAIEDTFVRFARMQGRPTLWLPGTDHAAIATQSKVEKILYQETGQGRADIGRDALLERIDEFVEESRSTIVHQTKKMGSSLDWSREAFTLDEPRNKAVNVAFKKMYDDGIIYRGDRIVNWDPKGQTTISDDEIVHQEETAKFYYFQYGPFVIGTARPETKFGDKYVVMHPEDTRYAEYVHGQTIELEWVNGPIIATIIKDTAVDPEFGTGVMTITPWHSTIDFEIAERHNLDKEQIIDLNGRLLPIAGEEFVGLPISEAREKIVAKLEEKGLFVKVEENYVHQVATAERTGATVEPQIMLQWFIGVNKEFTRDGETVTLKKLMQHAMQSRGGDITVLPERFEKIYFHWIDNLRDWCISRQIWYGHRIPVWYRSTKAHGTLNEVEGYKGEEIFCGTKAPVGDDWIQDSDTLDTWFSSGMWTFSTLGWGSDEELWQKQKYFHPTTLIESGYDILFPWIARMILMSTYFLGESPFKTIYLHGLVRDEEGRKMSKSLDNILDPLDVIKEYGTDALRLALTSGTTPGNDLRLGDEKLITMRNFVNKLWNISRYIHLQEMTDETVELRTPADHFLTAHFEKTRDTVTKHLEQYNLSLAIETLREFTITDFADWYVEIHKQEKNTPLLRSIFQELITLWHPFIPFVTEAIQQEVFTKDELLLVRNWPDPFTQSFSNEQTAIFETYRDLVTQIRTLRNTYNIPLKEILPISIDSPAAQIQSILNLARVTLTDSPVENGITLSSGMFTAQLSLGTNINIEEEKLRLNKEVTSAKNYLASLAAKLQNERFMTSAPENIRRDTEALAKETEEKITTLTSALNQLS